MSMNIYTKTTDVEPPAASPHVKIKMLQQMAEALEDEASALYRSAAL